MTIINATCKTSRTVTVPERHAVCTASQTPCFPLLYAAAARVVSSLQLPDARRRDHIANRRWTQLSSLLRQSQALNYIVTRSSAIADKPPDTSVYLITFSAVLARAGLQWTMQLIGNFYLFLSQWMTSILLNHRVHIRYGKTRMAGLQSREGCTRIDSDIWAQHIKMANRQPHCHSKCRANALYLAQRTIMAAKETCQSKPPMKQIMIRQAVIYQNPIR